MSQNVSHFWIHLTQFIPNTDSKNIPVKSLYLSVKMSPTRSPLANVDCGRKQIRTSHCIIEDNVMLLIASIKI